jgi:hypothetical protein
VNRRRGVGGVWFGEDFDEKVLAAEVGDDAMLDLADFTEGFDDADVFVDGTAGGADFAGSREQGWMLVSEVGWGSGDARQPLS